MLPRHEQKKFFYSYETIKLFFLFWVEIMHLSPSHPCIGNLSFYESSNRRGSDLVSGWFLYGGKALLPPPSLFLICLGATNNIRTAERGGGGRRGKAKQVARQAWAIGKGNSHFSSLSALHSPLFLLLLRILGVCKETCFLAAECSLGTFGHILYHGLSMPTPNSRL